MKIRCIRNGILFALLQSANAKGYFEERTKSGIVIAADKNGQGQGHEAFDRSVKMGRWGRVLAIGNECEDVKVGDYICVEPQMWTNSFDYDGVPIRKTDEDKVMLISEERPDVSFI